jgi:hypothetical protein
MSNFFKKFIQGGTIVPSPHIEKDFFGRFVDPLNVEWFSKEGLFEAVFYKDNTEYIARYSSEGLLIDYRINLPPDNLPAAIRSKLNTDEEIMNVVSIVSDMAMEYEIIGRDKDLNRYLIHISGDGNILSRIQL